jgi:hypothetical protein
MRKLHLKVVFYLTARYFLFLIIIKAIFKEVKWVKWSDLNSAEDWFIILFVLVFRKSLFQENCKISNSIKNL